MLNGLHTTFNHQIKDLICQIKDLITADIKDLHIKE